MGQQLWGPGLDAEVSYRRERLEQAYRGGQADVRTLGSWVRRLRAQRAARRDARVARPTTRAADLVSRFADTLDTVAARTDAEQWDARVTRRATEIADAMQAVRPYDDTPRRAA